MLPLLLCEWWQGAARFRTGSTLFVGRTQWRAEALKRPLRDVRGRPVRLEYQACLLVSYWR